jgi:polyphosphate kinase 2
MTMKLASRKPRTPRSPRAKRVTNHLPPSAPPEEPIVLDETTAIEEAPTFEVAPLNDPPTVDDSTEALLKAEKKKLKKLEKKQRKEQLKAMTKMASSFPMTELIEERIKSSIPKEIIERIEAAPSKKHIIGHNYPYEKVIKSEEYEAEMELLQIELVKMQTWVQTVGERIVLVFEGRDAAGKGGTILRFNENLNPRNARVAALAKPSEQERGQWYFQRYIQRLPTKGEIVFFDRSWYNRTGVEHVMGFCSPEEYLEFMRQAPEFERMMVRSGVKLFKFWFSVSRAEQLRRFIGRAKDPLKQWKLSPMDVESLSRWDQYTKAKEAMLFYTDTADAPWTIIRSDDKKRARLNAMRHVLNSIPYAGKDVSVVKPPDPKILGCAKSIYEHGEKTHAEAAEKA